MTGYSLMFNVVQTLLTAYLYVLVATALISWVPDLADTQLGYWLNRISEPYLRLFRRYIPSIPIGGILLDLSFIVAFIVYIFIQRGIISVLLMVVLGVS